MHQTDAVPDFSIFTDMSWLFSVEKRVLIHFSKNVRKKLLKIIDKFSENETRKNGDETYRAPRATRPSTLAGSMVRALLRHWKASVSWPALKNLIPSATLFRAHFPFCVLRNSSAKSFSLCGALGNTSEIGILSVFYPQFP